MAKPAAMKGMKRGGGTKNRGRTSLREGMGSKASVPQTVRRETNRPVEAGAGKQRGDRRDTSRLYTNNTKHKSRGSNPRPDVKTRAR